MSRSHRILAAALACATLACAPALAGAATPGKSLLVPRTVAVRVDEGRSYSSWIEGRLQTSLARIDETLVRTRLSAAKRQQIHYDLSFSASTIRARLAKIVQDGQVTDAERTEMRLLAAAIQHDLQMLHGSLDSWWLI